MDVMRQFSGIAITLSLLVVAIWWLRRTGSTWRPVRGARAMDITITYPVAASPIWPLQLADHEVTIR